MFPWHVKIEDEVKRYPDLKIEDVHTIRQWMKSQPHLPTVDDEVIGQFIYACYFDIEQTKRTIETCYTYKSSMPEFSKNWDVTSPSVADAGENLHIVLLPGLDNDGNQVILCKLNNMPASQYVFSECIKWIMMTVFLCQLENGIRPGFTIVYDADGFGMTHLFKNPLHQVKNYINFGQSASNIRVTGIRFINSSIVIKKLISWLRPFLNQEVMKMLSVHTIADEYFKDIPKEIVPSDYGGEAPSLAELTKSQREKMLKIRDLLIVQENMCCDESKRINGKNKKKNKDDGDSNETVGEEEEEEKTKKKSVENGKERIESPSFASLTLD